MAEEDEEMAEIEMGEDGEGEDEEDEEEDKEYCNALLDQLVNVDTPPDKIKVLLRELMGCLKSDQMKELVKQIIDCAADPVHQKILIKQFKNWESAEQAVPVDINNGSDVSEEVYYKNLIDKYLDPNTPDYEVKPTMNKLLNGALDPDKKKMVINIVNTTDADQKQRMVQRFLNSFKKVEAPKKEEPVIKPKKVEQTELPEEELKEANRDYKELMWKFIDLKTHVKIKRQIYGRLMEPDIDFEIKNLMVAVRMVTADTEDARYNEHAKILKDFIALREKAVEDEKDRIKKAEEDRIKAIEKKKRDKEKEKEDKIREKEKRLERKKLVEQIREERRIRNLNKSQHEIDDDYERKREREKVRAAIHKHRMENGESTRDNFGGKLKPSAMSDSEDEDNGWTIYKYPLTKPSPMEVKVATVDLINNNTLDPDDNTALLMEIERIRKSLAGVKVKEKGEREKKESDGKSEEKLKKEESLVKESESSEVKKENGTENKVSNQEKEVSVEKKPEIAAPVEKEETEEELVIIKKSIKMLKKSDDDNAKKLMFKNLMETKNLDLVTNFIKRIMKDADEKKAEKLQSFLALAIEVRETDTKKELIVKEKVNGEVSLKTETDKKDISVEKVDVKEEPKPPTEEEMAASMDLIIKPNLKRLKKSESNEEKQKVFKKLMDTGKLNVFTHFLKGIMKGSPDAGKVEKIRSWLKISSDLSEEKSKTEKRRLSVDQNGTEQVLKKPKLIDTETGKIEAKRKSKDEDDTKSESGEKIEKRKLSVDQNGTDQVIKKPKFTDDDAEPQTGNIDAMIKSLDEEEKAVESVDVSTLSWEELRGKYNLKHLNCNIKVKNERMVYRAKIAMQAKMDAKARADAEKKENEEKSKQKELDEKSQLITEQQTELPEKELKEANKDYKELIRRFIDLKTHVKIKRQIYGRLMEPDIDVDIKKLVVTIRYATADQQEKIFEDFIALREKAVQDEKVEKVVPSNGDSRSRSPSRSVSRSVSRSPSRSVSRSPSRSVSRSVSRSPSPAST